MKEMILFEPPDTVFLTFEGNLTPELIEDVIGKLNTYVRPGEKIRVAINVKNLADVPPESRETLRAMGSKFVMSKLAIIGASTKLRILGGFILKMLPGINDSRFVKTEPEARTWLDQDK